MKPLSTAVIVTISSSTLPTFLVSSGRKGVSSQTLRETASVKIPSALGAKPTPYVVVSFLTFNQIDVTLIQSCSVSTMFLIQLSVRT